MRWLATIGLLTSILVHLNAENSAKLIRTYRKVSLRGISADGRFLLVASRQKATGCPRQSSECFAEVLTVYRSDTGSDVGNLVTKGAGVFGPAGFRNGYDVAAIEAEPESDPVWVRWDAIAGKSWRTPIPGWKRSQLLCLSDDHRILAELAGAFGEPPTLFMLNIADEQPVKLQLQQPQQQGEPFRVSSRDVTANCARWRSRNAYLLESTNNDRTVYWIPTSPEVPAGSCRTFPGGIQDYVISQDSSLIAVATRGEERSFPSDRTSLDQPLLLTLLNSSDCSILRQFALRFPEKKGFFFSHEFPATMTISPDKTMLALAYGIAEGASGYAYFGLYSLAGGHRLATLRGDVDRKWPWSGFLNDEIASYGAPLGSLQFSPDSRMLYATSQHLRQWDVSGLK